MGRWKIKNVRSNDTAAPAKQTDPVASEIWRGVDPNAIAKIPFQAIREMQKKTYVYFDLNAVLSKQQYTNRECTEARNLADSGNITITEATTAYFRGKTTIQMYVYATLKENYSTYSMEISFGPEGLNYEYCSQPDCYRRRYGYGLNSRKLCKHELALMYLLEDYIVENNPGDATDTDAYDLLKLFHKNRSTQEMEQVTGRQLVFHIEPRMECDGNGFYASFRGGTEKLYVLKNLTEFVGQMDRGETVTFGKNTQVPLAQCQLDEKSQAWYDLIQTNVRELSDRCRQLENKYVSYDFSMLEVKGNILLTDSLLDRFYELVQGTSIQLADKSGESTQKRTIRCREGNVKIRLRVSPQMDAKKQYMGLRLTGDLPHIQKGRETAYAITQDDYLMRMDVSTAKAIEPLCRIADDGGSLSVLIGRKRISDFLYTILPMLRQYADVEEDLDGVAAFLPDEVAFRFYLDVEADNLICRATAVYGDWEKSIAQIGDDLRSDPKEDFRDLYREGEVFDTILCYFPEINQKRDLFHCARDEEAVYNVLCNGVEELMAFGEVQSTAAFKRLGIRRIPKITVGVAVESEIMNLTISSDDISREELLEVLEGYRRKKKFYRLKNGDFINLEEENLEALCSLMDTLQLSPQEFVRGKMNLPTYRALYLDQMLAQNSGIYAKRDSRFRKLVKEFKTVDDSDFEVPESLQDIMRNYQVTGYKWLRTLAAYGFGGILADDMGLGKTLQTIAVMLAYKEEGATEPWLVVCPASLVYNWQAELQRFAPQLSVCMMVGTQKERETKLRGYADADVVVTSYDLLKRDIDQYEDCHFLGQVLDEAQFIKNHSTAAAKAVKLVHSRIHYALTGTPIENRLSELWSIFDFLMPGFLYTYENFRKELETPIVKDKDEAASMRLKHMVAPFILRRLKKDVLKDLPDKLEKVYYAKFEKKQQKVYDAQVAHMQALLGAESDSEYAKDKIRVLAELTRIRQICCDPSLIFEDYDGGSAKREACMDLIHQAIEGEHRILLFSQFTSMLALLEEDLQKEGIAYYKITGETPKQKRVEMVQEFNEGDVPLFLISLKAGGTGLNLTGADVVIHYDPWWNLAVQNQATDRAHRIGQTNVVSVYRLIARDSIEENILKMQETKKDLAEEILSGETGGLGTLDRDELLELLGV